MGVVGGVVTSIIASLLFPRTNLKAIEIFWNLIIEIDLLQSKVGLYVVFIFQELPAGCKDPWVLLKSPGD